jgi:hypothetical protein
MVTSASACSYLQSGIILASSKYKVPGIENSKDISKWSSNLVYQIKTTKTGTAHVSIQSSFKSYIKYLRDKMFTAVCIALPNSR